jgi:RNA polymerase sigma-70 factor (ECF subfamily)
LSADEIGTIMNASLPAVKAALHCGRARVRELSQQPEDVPLPILAESARWLLGRYVEHFNARDFDAIRNTLAEEVWLELVNKSRARGRSKVARYFDNYARVQEWRLVFGLVDWRPALLVRDPGSPSLRPTYFVLLDWEGERVVNIQDFRFARYATEAAELFVPDEWARYSWRS